MSDTTQEDVFLASSGFCYSIFYEKVDWYTAFQLCRSRGGGQLASVNDQEISDVLTAGLQGVMNIIQGNGLNGFWIGLHIGQWKWLDGKLSNAFVIDCETLVDF